MCQLCNFQNVKNESPNHAFILCNYWTFAMHLKEDVYKVRAPKIVTS
jgi:hypothetical protein